MSHYHRLEQKLDAKYYKIWRQGAGRWGFNSFLSGVLGHLHIAETKGLLPVVDMENHRSFYSEDFPIFGTTNMWDYYFLPVSDISVKGMYDSKQWLDSEGGYPHKLVNPMSLDAPFLLDMYSKYVQLRPETSEELEKARSNMDISKDFLAVHFRGSNMRTFPFHPMPPTKTQIFRRIDKALEESAFEKIFLVSEKEKYVEAFVRRYGDLISYLEVARSGKKISLRVIHVEGIGIYSD